LPRRAALRVRPVAPEKLDAPRQVQRRWAPRDAAAQQMALAPQGAPARQDAAAQPTRDAVQQQAREPNHAAPAPLQFEARASRAPAGALEAAVLESPALQEHAAPHTRLHDQDHDPHDRHDRCGRPSPGRPALAPARHYRGCSFGSPRTTRLFCAACQFWPDKVAVANAITIAAVERESL